MRKSLFAVLIVGVMALGASSASAVTLEMTSSPESGSTVSPGDEVSLGLTITNETDEKDIIMVRFNMTIETDRGVITIGGSGRPLRLRLAPGQSVSKSIAAVIPEGLADLPFDFVKFTIKVVAEGKRSQTSAEDSVTLTLEPAPIGG